MVRKYSVKDILNMIIVGNSSDMEQLGEKDEADSDHLPV